MVNKKQNKKQIRSLLLGNNVWNFGEAMFGPLLAVFTQRVGGGVLEITSISAAYIFTQGVFKIIFGAISDYRSKKVFDLKKKEKDFLLKKFILLLGFLLSIVFTFLYIFVSTPLQLLFIQIGLGISTALADPSWDSLYSYYSVSNNKNKPSGLQWGIADGTPDLFIAIGVMLGGFVITSLDFKILFLLMGGIQIIAFLCQLPIIFNKDK